MAGWVFESGDFKIKPGAAYHMIYDGQLGVVLDDLFDVNVQLNYMDRFWIGALYRKSQTYGLNGGIQFDRINIGYAFDRTVVGGGFLALTSHEFFLTYYIGKPEVE